ncbi:transposase [Streptosporangium canum]|uniref:transposase n=1 Tax=Streptosporangium canum TaxID=324952 RepID=UPI003680038B
MPVLPSWLTEPLWGQFAALLPERPTYAATPPLGCHCPRITDRIVFDKMLQLLRFGCSYRAIADTTCSATTIRNRRDEWTRLSVFAKLKQIALESYDRIVGLVLDQIAVDGSITKAPGGGEVAGRSPCYERRATVVDAFFDLADTAITVRSLVRQAWTTHGWDGRPNRRP